MMKKIILFSLFGFFTTLTFGQEQEVYLNDDLNYITKSEFDSKKDEHYYYIMRFDLDTTIANVKVQKIKKGKISKTKLDSIRTELAVLSRQPISPENILVINYYHGLDKCNSSGDKSYVREKYKSFSKRIKRHKNVSQIFMYKSPEGTAEYGEQLKWIKDESGIIENTFFPIHYPCGSFVMIDEFGNFLAVKGEYNINIIFGMIKNKETTFSPNY